MILQYSLKLHKYKIKQFIYKSLENIRELIRFSLLPHAIIVHIWITNWCLKKSFWNMLINKIVYKVEKTKAFGWRREYISDVEHIFDISFNFLHTLENWHENDFGNT